MILAAIIGRWYLHAVLAAYYEYSVTATELPLWARLLTLIGVALIAAIIVWAVLHRPKNGPPPLPRQRED